MTRFTLIFIFLLVHLSACAQPRGATRDFERAKQNVRIREYAEALRYVNAAINRAPEFTEAWMLKGDLQVTLGDTEGAMVSYREAKKSGGSDNIYYRWGKAALESGVYVEADSVLSLYVTSTQVGPRYKEIAADMARRARYAQTLLENPVNFEPQWLGPNVNQLQMQYFPSISGDGTQLVFTARNFEGEEASDEDFYISYFRNGEWTKAQRLQGYLNTTGNEGAQSLSSDGTMIFFAGCDRPEGYGSCDIYVSLLQENGIWSEPINMGDSINSRFWDTQPSISADGKTLVFVRGGNSMAENTDIFISEFKHGHWTEAKRIPGTVNTRGTENSPFLHFDGRSLYFASKGHDGMGDTDLFVARKDENGEWGNVQNLGYPINTYEKEFSLIVAPDGRTAYYASDRERNEQYLNLFSFQLPEEVRATPIAWLNGSVSDEETQLPVRANLQFVNLETGEVVLSTITAREGRFHVSLPSHSRYALNVTAKGYLFYSQNISLEDQDEASAEELEIELKPIREGQAVVLNNVFFDSDSYALKSESLIELDRLVEFLKENPTVKLSIDGHTDNEGSPAYNKELSKNRAGAVLQYLVSKNINEGRLSSNGYGAEKPVADNSTEAGRAQNRRTEMTIIQK